MRRSCLRMSLLVGLTAASACDRAPAGRSSESAEFYRVSTDLPEARPERVRQWSPALGRAFLVPGHGAAGDLIVYADSGSVHPGDATFRQPLLLLGRSGLTQRASVPAVWSDNECLRARVDPATAGESLAPFALGVFVNAADVIAALPADSAGSLAPGDSTAIARRTIALASSLPPDTAGRFTGLTYVLRSLWSVTLPSGGRAVVATLRRQVPLEATPLEERTVLIAEPDASGNLVTVFGEQSHGAEESVQATEFLVALQSSRDSSTMMIVARDFGDRVAYTLLERNPGPSPQPWRERWTSVPRACY